MSYVIFEIDDGHELAAVSRATFVPPCPATGGVGLYLVGVL